MQIADGFATRVVWCELHGTHAGAAFALHLTGTRYVDVGECLRQWSLTGGNPIGDGSHGAERTPCAGGINEREYDANDGGYDDNSPEHSADSCPHGQTALAPRHETQLNAEHGEDEEHHEQTEAEGAHELGNRAMGGVLRQQTVVHVAARTHVSAPPAAFKNTRYHRTDHADECQQAYNREEPPKDYVRNDNPIERYTRCLKMAVKLLLAFLITIFFCHRYCYLKTNIC